jgi:hypothetical protein
MKGFPSEKATLTNTTPHQKAFRADHDWLKSQLIMLSTASRSFSSIRPDRDLVPLGLTTMKCYKGNI